MTELHFAAGAAAVEPAVDHQSAPDPTAGIGIDDDPGALPGPDERLAEGCGIGVVFEDHRHRAERPLRLACHPRRQREIAPASDMKTRRHDPLLPVHRPAKSDADGADGETIAGCVIDDAGNLRREHGADSVGPAGRIDPVAAAQEDTAIGGDDR